MSNDYFGGSSQYSFSPGMESTFIDHLLVRPTTSWRGVRGVRSQFGGESYGDEDFESRADDIVIEQAEEDFWDLPDSMIMNSDPDDIGDFDLEMEEEIEEDEEMTSHEAYGRLYMGQEGHRMQSPSHADLGALSGHSGRSGYRGGRPTFGTSGANVSFGPMSYTGNEIASFTLAMSGLAIIGRSLKIF